MYGFYEVGSNYGSIAICHLLRKHHTMLCIYNSIQFRKNKQKRNPLIRIYVFNFTLWKYVCIFLRCLVLYFTHSLFLYFIRSLFLYFILSVSYHLPCHLWTHPAMYPLLYGLLPEIFAIFLVSTSLRTLSSDLKWVVIKLCVLISCSLPRTHRYHCMDKLHLCVL